MNFSTVKTEWFPFFSSNFSDSFLSLSSALTVLKQEIPSPFGNDQVKKAAKASPLNKDQVDEIEQATGTTIKTNATNIAGNNTNVAGVSNANNIACHLNGNSNSSASNDFGNCLESVNQQQQQQSNQNDPNDERNDSNNLSMKIAKNSLNILEKHE